MPDFTMTPEIREMRQKVRAFMDEHIYPNEEFLTEGEDEALDLSGDPVARRFVENFIVLWSGDRGRLERLYRAELSAEGERWRLSLAPRGAPLDAVIDRIELRGDRQRLLEMVVRDRDGDRTITAFGAVDMDRTFSAPELERLFEKGLPLDTATGTR